MLTSLENKEYILNLIKETGGIKFNDVLLRYKQDNNCELSSQHCRNCITALKKYELIELKKTGLRTADYWICINKESTYADMLERITKRQNFKPVLVKPEDLPPYVRRYMVEDIEKLREVYGKPEKKIYRSEPRIGSTFGTMDY